ncbi:MAG: hypothetical protein IPN80_01280 [Flavobacterium sp.]|nr:hypothetical protein [Flavobacterium sp.]
MKLLSLLFLTIFLGKGCDAEQKQDIESAVIEYTATTRGFYQQIVVQNQKFTVTKDRNGNEKLIQQSISKADWKDIIEAFQDVDLEGFKDLKGPTEKRFYDGAAIGNIKVIYKGKTYETNGFDHGNPPLEIEKLVNKITQLGLPNE